MHKKQPIQAIVLAAGKSTRLATGRNKLLEKMCGQEMILFATRLLTSLDLETSVVVGHQHELIKRCITKKHGMNITFVDQKEQKGTAHALLCTKDSWHADHILIMNGDMPLVTKDIVQELIDKHVTSQATLSFVMAHNADPTTSYGRVVKTDDKMRIIEAKDFTGDASEHCCINAGIYIMKRDFLVKHLAQIEQNEKAREHYITDLVHLASKHTYPIATITAPFDYIRGINTQHELWMAEQIQRTNIITYWMERGVRFSVAHNVHIDLDVTIGAGTYIGCGVHLLFGTQIGKNCKIHEYTSLENVKIGDNTRIYPFTIIKETTVGSNTMVGPFAHVKDNSIIQDEAHIGNYVEITRSVIGKGSKSKHLSYLGDTQVGSNVNIGAGTITCNYDGRKKHKTVIEDDTFIGSNNTLVAPVTIKKGAFTAAGSTINEDVPADALGIGRTQQVNKLGYAQRLLNKKTKLALKKDKQQDQTKTPKKEQKATFMGAKKTTSDMLTEHS